TSASAPPVRGGTTDVGIIIATQAVFETNFGTLVAICDDCVVQQTLPFPFTFFGQTFNSVFVNNNGNLSFNIGDSTFTPSIGGFPSRPRISPFCDDLVIACSKPFNLDGGFIIFSPNASGGYDVQLVPPAPVLPQSAAAVRRPLTAASVQAETATVQGTVFDSQGNPLAGVEVDVTCSRALTYKGVTTTDQSGHYSLAGVPMGGVNIVALRDGAVVALGGANVLSDSATLDLYPARNQTKTTSARPN